MPLLLTHLLQLLLMKLQLSCLELSLLFLHESYLVISLDVSGPQLCKQLQHGSQQRLQLLSTLALDATVKENEDKEDTKFACVSLLLRTHSLC